MPHLVLAGHFELPRPSPDFSGVVDRWGRAVLKIETLWRSDVRRDVLVEGIVVEYSRPLHPIAIAAPHHDNTIVRLWPRVVVERTPAVQRWLCLVAGRLRQNGAGDLLGTNIADEIWADLEALTA